MRYIKPCIIIIILSVGARSASAIVDEAMKAAKRMVNDQMNGKGGVSLVAMLQG